jgi:hypothetical protein
MNITLAPQTHYVHSSYSQANRLPLFLSRVGACRRFGSVDDERERQVKMVISRSLYPN